MNYAKVELWLIFCALQYFNTSIVSGFKMKCPFANMCLLYQTLPMSFCYNKNLLNRIPGIFEKVTFL